jgi:hypothetical protein
MRSFALKSPEAKHRKFLIFSANRLEMIGKVVADLPRAPTFCHWTPIAS